MALVLQPAVKILKPLKMLLYGPTNSGKTLGALKLALGFIMQKRGCTEIEAYKHILLIDTEYQRGALYSKLGPYNYISITAPYDTTKLTKIILEANSIDQIDVIIGDSLTHFWVKEGGILDKKAQKDKLGGNTYTNWLELTTVFNNMLDIILASPKIFIGTARAVSDTVLVEDAKGKMKPKTFGLKPEIRAGTEYEFDIVFSIDKNTHTLITEKGVPGLAPTFDIATPEVGQHIYDLFVADRVLQTRTVDEIQNNIRTLAVKHNLITFVQLNLSGKKLDDLTEDELIKLENEMLQEIKNKQIKRG